jgi:hypothetical protein
MIRAMVRFNSADRNGFEIVGSPSLGYASKKNTDTPPMNALACINYASYS